MAREEEVVPNIGDMDDISGHETLERLTSNKLKIDMGDYHWILEADSPIKVTVHDRSG